MFGCKDVRIKVGNPLLTLLGDAQIAQGFTDVRIHGLPEELRIVGAKVGSAVVFQKLACSCFTEFAKQGSRIPKIIDVRELADQVGRTKQAWKIIRRRVRFLS